ncbi:efflux RND transporter periplasmic adaptor subunit [Bradyrhizobium sp.]|uniref:efflux RND transporter periplasmic adaptor subunit n=1 Tax=Bradyrhizobium sp. TaxID=376 RepID=UPI0027354F8C|nr:efflux RND transporter periplasmic adaptor subunit [Bradyrhizobium sp.]MDP3694307.1 efflux RND transporter periplasmic adaptor subunit [Bradyrhizobium sp.]
MRRRRLVLVAVLLAILVAAGAGAWAFYLRPVNVRVSQVERDVSVEVFGLGTVEARVTSKVGFKVSGVLVDLRADVGERVAKGSVLARLDDREQSARVARTRASIAQAEANVQRATASVEKARANHNNARSISERRQKLFLSNSTSVEAAETAQAVQDAAFGDLNLASSDVQVARASVNDAKAQQLLESATLDFHTLAAPYDAMVTARTKELGSALGPGEPVFTLIDPATVWVLAYIDESKAGEIRVGKAAQIVLRSQPGRRIAGRVARIEPESDRVNEERRVAVAFDQIPAEFNLGEQAEVYITTVHLAQPRLVPEAAIAGLGKNRGTVWTVEDGRLQQHTVTLGHRLLDGRFEITGGVPDNALVVSQLRSGLRVGRAAKVAAGKSP